MGDSATKFPALKDFKPFLGYGPEDYDQAKAFYRALGFEVLWDDGESACEFDTRIGHRFLATLHHGRDRANAGMLHFWVESVDDWAAYLKTLALDENFPGVKVAEPSVVPWGWRILHVWDPGGYLLHFAEPHSDENKAFYGAAPWLK